MGRVTTLLALARVTLSSKDALPSEGSTRLLVRKQIGDCPCADMPGMLHGLGNGDTNLHMVG